VIVHGLGYILHRRECAYAKVVLTGYFCSDFANLEFVRWKSLISGIGEKPLPLDNVSQQPIFQHLSVLEVQIELKTNKSCCFEQICIEWGCVSFFLFLLRTACEILKCRKGILFMYMKKYKKLKNYK
jgi:hypothetical protein